MAWELETQRILNFNLTHTPAGAGDEDFHYIDLAKMLSAVNRQSFRQGMTYDVANIVFHDSDTSETEIRCCTAPNTWSTQAAWSAGLVHWLAQQTAGLEATSLNSFGPWHDFKVYINEDMIADPDKPNFIDSEGNTLTAGEWIYSKFIVADEGSADPDHPLIGLMGAHVGTPTGGNMTYASLLEVFENTINQPQEDPDLGGSHSTLWSRISAQAPDVEVIAEIVDDLDLDNDLPGYSPSVISGAGAPGAGRPSEPWLARQCCIPGGGSHMAAVGGFPVPCGLLVIETAQATDGDIIGVQLELAPGDYKGVSARKMRRPGNLQAAVRRLL